jgi:hypothetical protein
MLVNGSWRHGRSGHTAEDVDPYPSEVLVRIPLMDSRRDESLGWLVHESGSTRIKAELEWDFALRVTLEAATFPSRMEGPIQMRPR